MFGRDWEIHITGDEEEEEEVIRAEPIWKCETLDFGPSEILLPSFDRYLSSGS